MSYKANVFKIMIASPSDVASEKNIIREVIAEWNVINSYQRKIVLLPVAWETHSTPSMGDRPQAIINKHVLKDCDLLVGVFWTRVGTATGEYDSGTIEEIEEHLRTNKPTMIYFSNAPVRPDSVDQAQYNSLKNFENSCQQRGLYEVYESLSDFKEKFNRQLQIKLNSDKYFSSTDLHTTNVMEIIESSIPNIPELTKEAKILLKEAANSHDGNILKLSYIGGMSIEINFKEFINDNNPRTKAIWEDALNELERKELIKDQGHKGEVYRVTRYGFEIADLITL